MNNTQEHQTPKPPSDLNWVHYALLRHLHKATKRKDCCLWVWTTIAKVLVFLHFFYVYCHTFLEYSRVHNNENHSFQCGACYCKCALLQLKNMWGKMNCFQEA